ncbi:MAG: DUF615 domain-containing protein, partial [Thiotrichaceae bacterium]|nr:DUF615 domain-containing protein [Thiotrichaceae bacterium]
ELQRLGEGLIKLPKPRLEQMELPDKLFNALIDAQSIKSNVAARRQRQHIGALMRDVDPELIRHYLLPNNADVPRESKIDKKTKKWVNRLLTGDLAVLEELVSACPGLERQRLRQLLRNIKKEKTTGKSSKSLKTLELLIVRSMNNK